MSDKINDQVSIGNDRKIDLFLISFQINNYKISEGFTVFAKKMT